MANRIILASSLLLSLLTARAAFAAESDKTVHVATCRDGKEMYAKTNEHRGACSGHGGVASWANGSPVKSHERKTEYK